jgi:hypothetical protein
MPSGIVVTSSEKSQHQNRDIAMKALKSRLYQMELDRRNAAINEAHENKGDAGWGNQIRSYVLQPYQMVKDLRTGFETSDTGGVLDGDLDGLMASVLAMDVSGKSRADARARVRRVGRRDRPDPRRAGWSAGASGGSFFCQDEGAVGLWGGRAIDDGDLWRRGSWELGARALSGRIARREVSPVEVMREVLARIEAVNGGGQCHRQSLRDREALMGEARLAEAMPPEGWLHGVPVAIKDLVDVKGLRSTRGSAIWKDHVPKVDDGLARRLRAAGAIVIGKTNVPAFGLGSHTVNPVFGATRNPYDLALSAGGSSGGAAVALAMRMLPVADGSDMMGSLRNPAAWNNVYGFRPTAGLVPGSRARAWCSTGCRPTGRWRAISGIWRRFWRRCRTGPIGPDRARRPARPRIGWLGDWGGAYAMEAGILAQSEAALAVMEGLGWAVEPVAPPFRRRPCGRPGSSCGIRGGDDPRGPLARRGRSRRCCPRRRNGR